MSRNSLIGLLLIAAGISVAIWFVHDRGDWSLVGVLSGYFFGYAHRATQERRALHD